ncbi:hypothetical protein UlMin_002873 [Ulmus minor]
MEEEKKQEVLKRAHNTLILSLSDKVLREINIGVEYEDEDKALVLLHSLPKSYEHFVDILQHGRETISLEDVVGALKSNEQKRKSEMGDHTGDGLINDVKPQEGGAAAVVQNDDGYESSDVLVVSTKYSDRHWIMDSGDALGKFKEWKKMVKVQTGKKLKKLRTDNGLEFLNYEFDQFCKDEGIVRHKTVPYTPQQNGLAERMNRTLLERVRCMLLEGGVPRRFWGEAVNTAPYLVNRCPSSALDFKTPEEMWTGHPPKFDNLRVFGCVAYKIKVTTLRVTNLQGTGQGDPERHQRGMDMRI